MQPHKFRLWEYLALCGGVNSYCDISADVSLWPLPLLDDAVGQSWDARCLMKLSGSRRS
jgi:hypothetical protein